MLKIKHMKTVKIMLKLLGEIPTQWIKKMPICFLLLASLMANGQKVKNLPTISTANLHGYLLYEDSTKCNTCVYMIQVDSLIQSMGILTTPTVLDTVLNNNAKYILPTNIQYLVNQATANTSDTIYFSNIVPYAGQKIHFAQWNNSTTIYVKGALFKSGTTTTNSLNMGFTPWDLMYDVRKNAWIPIQ